MRCIECPDNYSGSSVSLFIAGGISGCSDWQKEFVKMLKDEDIVLYNPRRKNYLNHNPSITEEQITWEHINLLKADATSFWFTHETVCPITLFELGKQLSLNKPVFIGVHPEYSRKEDVFIQVKLMRPEIVIVNDLESLSKQVKEWIKKYNNS
ncbi:MAG: nucleoside 2-deoxyribosyltransferase domain-containing protein [Candidatus Woesearchaeota archaeon]